MSPKRLLGYLSAASLGGALAFSSWFMVQGARAADKALAEYQDCSGMLTQIQALGTRPALASDRERVADEMSRLIEKSAGMAGIQKKDIVRISPQQPQRLEGSAYKEKPTTIYLRGVTLQQLAAMISGLTKEESLQAKSIRIAAPSPEDTGNLWSAEVVVTYLIFDPTRQDNSPKQQ